MQLADLNGRTHQPLNASAIATVIIFITTDCPIANSYAPEINAMVREYGGTGVRFFLAHVDPSVRLDQALQHARDYGLQAPVLMDDRHELVRAVGVSVTPEAAVIDRNGNLVYRGRIDDRHIDFGKKRAAPAQRDLREAIDAVIAGREVAEARTRAVGCFIPEARD